MNEARPYASLSSGLLARKGTAKPAMRPQGYGGLEDLGWNDMGHAPGEQGRPPAPPEHVPSSIAALTPAPKHGRPAYGDGEEHDEALEAEEAEAAEAVHEFPAAEEAEGVDDVDDVEEADQVDLIAAEEPEDVSAGYDADAGYNAGDGYDADEGYEAEAVEQAEEEEETAEQPVYDDPAPFEAEEAAYEAPAEPYQAPSVVAQQRAILERFEGEEETAPVVSAGPAPVVPLPARHSVADQRKAAFTLRLDSDRHLRLRLACAVSGRSAQQIVARALDEALASIPEIEALASQVPAKPGRASAKRN